LLVPNIAESYTALETDLLAFFNILYGGASFSLFQVTDPRERFTVNVKAASAFDLSALLNNLPLEVKAAHA
jgi:hypothetical protein